MTDTAAPVGTLEQVAIGDITTGDNVRSELGDLDELAASIRAVGILEPVVVTRNGKGYELVLGHRRLKAAKLAGLKSVPAIVRDVVPEARTELQLIENLHRADLPPLDEARGYQRLVDDFGYSQRAIADAVGRAQSHISKRLALVQLSPPAQKALETGKVDIQEAVELTKLNDQPERQAAVVKAAGSPYGNVRNSVDQQLEELKHQRRFEELVVKVKAGKVPYLEAAEDVRRPHGKPPAGAQEIQGWRGLEMDAAARRAHAKLDCHAATVLIDHDGVRIAQICTKPATHRKKPKKSPTEVKQDRERKALAAAGKTRRAFVKRALEKAPTRQEALPLIIDELIRASHQSVLKVACELLGVEPVRTKSKYGSDFINYAGPLRELAASTERAGLRVGLGIFAAAADESASSWWGSGGIPRYFKWLRSRRYRPTEVERAKLAKVAKSE